MLSISRRLIRVQLAFRSDSFFLFARSTDQYCHDFINVPSQKKHLQQPILFKLNLRQREISGQWRGPLRDDRRTIVQTASKRTALPLACGVRAAALALMIMAPVMPASAQNPKTQSTPASEQQKNRTVGPIRATAAGEGEQISRINNWTLGLAGGPIEGAFIWFAADLGTALNDGENLRILPIITSGAGDNVKDLVYLKGIDVALTNTDVLEHIRRTSNIANLNNRIHYIAPLFTTDFHVYARPEIKSVADLAGKKVGMHTPGGAASISGPIIFDRLGVAVQPVFVNNSVGYEKLKSGEFAAIVHMVAKPNDLFKKMKVEPGFHFLPVQYSDKLDDLYLPSKLTSEDYPNLIPSGEVVETVAITTVLAVYNWSKTGDRFRRVARFIDYFIDGIEKLQKPPFNAKWKDVNLAANVPGWTRYWYAEEAVAKLLATRQQKSAAVPAGANSNSGSQEVLFREFLSWYSQQQSQGGNDVSGKGLVGDRSAEFRAFLNWRSKQPAAQ
jgi:TRAP-type uncharacterized transport system substrate-binding protein